MRGNLAGNTTQLRLAIAELQELLRRQGEACPTARQAEACPTWQELAALTGFLEEALSHIEAGEKQAVRHYAELERRLLDIENSRFLRTLQWPGRFLGDWKGRLGQLLLHSPLHPLYLKLVHPHLTADRYRLWVESEPAPGQRRLPRQPLLSLILPVHNPRRDWLEAAVASVLGQTYGCWQLCVCDDASAQDWVATYFNALSATEPRIRFARSSEHLGIAGALSRAGELASGEYAAFLDQDDVLAPHAFDCVAEAVQDAQPDLLYSDEDYLDDHARRGQPIFKPAFSPDLLRCGMYLGHLLVVRTATLRELGWFRAGYACNRRFMTDPCRYAETAWSSAWKSGMAPDGLDRCTTVISIPNTMWRSAAGFRVGRSERVHGADGGVAVHDNCGAKRGHLCGLDGLGRSAFQPRRCRTTGVPAGVRP